MRGEGKTLGRSAPQAPAGTRRPGAGLTRAEVRSRIADRLAGRLSPAGLATWARGEWVTLQRGAAVEAGQRDQLEEVLQALFLAVQPRASAQRHAARGVDGGAGMNARAVAIDVLARVEATDAYLNWSWTSGSPRRRCGTRATRRW